MTTSRTFVYGLIVDSDRPLFHPRSAAPCVGGEADIVIRHAEHEINPREPASDDVLLRYANGEARYFCERCPDGTYALVFDEACEFRISADLRTVTVIRHRGADLGIEDVLASGALLAWQLYMRGSLVLHASAVQVGDRAIAFVGGSGRGKSTMATLMCAAGARIITDDLLRIDFSDGVPETRLGSSELRLRKGADTLAARFDQGAAPGRRSSADDRQILRPIDDADDRVPLAAIYVPVPERENSITRVDRISAPDALFALLRFPRLLGWVEPDVRTRQFALSSRLVADTPLSIAHVPWGPPFPADIADDIVADLDVERVPRRLDLTAAAP
ncbi:hypothetical protein HII28_08375 [Planctomonas sp. JC2975]|uniref:hypothetical protein n=1 Tax=Planctomonas sp. JC2975 TaxID=2729626 RepID=UPI001474C70A|nr:hypothetical protein [Planctomonas sp. JC2975]NNC11893.1 hypothetical protein [Planctomonas sp. JC2975]